MKTNRIIRLRRLGMIFTAMVLLTACAGAGGDSVSVTSGTGLCANELFPVVDGATWSYLATGGPTGDYTYTTTISNVREDGFTLTTQFDDFQAVHEWACTPEGLVALEYGGQDASMTAGGLSATYESLDSTGVTFPSVLPEYGDYWEQTFTVRVDITRADLSSITGEGTVSSVYQYVGPQSVSSPVGSFEAERVQVREIVDLEFIIDGGTTFPMTVTTSSIIYLVNGVGIFKSTSITAITGADPIDSLSLLQSYSIP